MPLQAIKRMCYANGAVPFKGAAVSLPPTGLEQTPNQRPPLSSFHPRPVRPRLHVARRQSKGVPVRIDIVRLHNNSVFSSERKSDAYGVPMPGGDARPWRNIGRRWQGVTRAAGFPEGVKQGGE